MDIIFEDSKVWQGSFQDGIVPEDLKIKGRSKPLKIQKVLDNKDSTKAMETKKLETEIKTLRNQVQKHEDQLRKLIRTVKNVQSTLNSKVAHEIQNK